MRWDFQTAPAPRKLLWTGRILSSLAVLFLLWDSVIKLIPLTPVAEAFTRLGYPVRLAPGIGILELVCVALYVIPATSVPGAIVLTGFLGGAIASHVRVGDPLLTHVFFPLYVALLLWGGLLLRDDGLRAFTKRSMGAPAAARPHR
ncbi:MAG TPA: DoxX family protein [Gemmatimonadaceae bacterium]|nr:DoxX family protein [Gemmatimonadaceae bacterium]